MLKRIFVFVRQRDWFAVAIEILVVMAGLLLAFQLDRWREDHAERQQERSYVNRLIADMQTDIPEIESAIALQQLRLELVDLLIAVGEDPKAAMAKPTVFMGAVSQAAYTYTPELTSYTFDNLRSTGDLRLIRSATLKNALFDYYAFDASQRQYRPLHFATEHRHFELAAGVLNTRQAQYIQQHWLFFYPENMDAPSSERPKIEGVFEAAQRLQSKSELIAWLPFVRQMQLEQIEVHGDRLKRGRNVLDLAQNYAREISGL
ncbi:conserved hypothetical protein [Luminiphilus syltensis NOR5-1B]|uniref:Uncharacterized protein n=1 Tax=Luminiphilus syltensis NOR5-1B TaxID=565045 RepID=B8KVS5_9GAMM|nr:DUF6090 family protein [Luminiphilus syltensis]EED36175.1 conserved hypothetical protein [Luminiphilus syltensis NOR5-1B]